VAILKVDQNTNSYRLVVTKNGVSSVVLWIRLLDAMRNTDIETHLVFSPFGSAMITQETIRYVNDVLSMAHEVHNQSDVGVRIAFISFPNQGLVVIPCSVKTLFASANSYADDLIARSVDVTFERRTSTCLRNEGSFFPYRLPQLDEPGG
jgi:flavin prenyltransferase